MASAREPVAEDEHRHLADLLVTRLAKPSVQMEPVTGVRGVEGVKGCAEAHELHRVLHHHPVRAPLGGLPAEARPTADERGGDVVARLDQVAMAERVVAGVPQVLRAPARAEGRVRAHACRLDDAVLVAVAALAAAEGERAIDAAHAGDDDVRKLVRQRVTVVQASATNGLLERIERRPDTPRRGRLPERRMQAFGDLGLGRPAQALRRQAHRPRRAARPRHDENGESAYADPDCADAHPLTVEGDSERAKLSSVEGRSELVEALSRLSLFADLSEPQLQDVAHSADEEVFEEGRRILRENLSGSGLFFVLDGEVSVRLAGRELARLGRGEFFGEISVVLQTAPMADVVAASLVRCLVVPGPEVEPFLVERPRVLYRMFQAEARRLMAAERRAAGL